jgi:hypothetical protein
LLACNDPAVLFFDSTAVSWCAAMLWVDFIIPSLFWLEPSFAIHYIPAHVKSPSALFFSCGKMFLPEKPAQKKNK